MNIFDSRDFHKKELEKQQLPKHLKKKRDE